MTYIHTASSLGNLVRVMLLKAVSEHRLLENLPILDNCSSIMGRELIVSWLKLYCLKVEWSLLSVLSAQIEVVVSFQHMDYSYSHIFMMGGLMICSPISHHEGLFPMRDKRSNGKPKTCIVPPLYNGEIRRESRTLGSTSKDSPFDIEVDGVSVVPVIKDRGRETGEEEENVEDVARMGQPEEGEEMKETIERWKTNDFMARGVDIPNKFLKLREACKENESLRVGDIYSLVHSKEMLDLAYQKIKSNPGNMTPGTTGETLAGWGKHDRDILIGKLKDESFQFSLARSKEIPKPQGGTRGLKITSPRDKLVQQVMTFILEAIFDPGFSSFSFGFREGLGCHDALKHIHKKFQGTRWFIEGDISKCFDEIDHDTLIYVLQSRIKDTRFINLIRKALNAGYLDVYNNPKSCIVGTPQGSIISPILCNIFMGQFDNYIENEILPRFNRGKTRATNPIYNNLKAKSYNNFKRFKKTGVISYFDKAKQFRKEFMAISSTVSNDPGFRRCYYVRYADDWLIGFAGTFKEAALIKQLCADFLSSIKMRLNIEKTRIVSGSKGVVFLGAKIHIPLNQLRFKKVSGPIRRANLGVRLNCPLDRVIKKLYLNNFCNANGVSKPKFSLYPSDKDQIIGTYIAVYRGILNYYSFADNFKRLAQTLFSILRNSAAKLLAAKFKLKTCRQAIIKYSKYLGRNDEPKFTDPKKFIRGSLFKLGGRSRSRVDPMTYMASRAMNLNRRICIICGSTERVEMHHVRMLKDLNRYIDIEQVMAARKRKQAPVCKSCHVSKHIELRNINKGLNNG